MRSASFERFFVRHVGSAFARQLALADLLGERSWGLDLRTGFAKFGDDLTFPVQLLGTEAFDDSSWLWAWANDASDLPPHVITTSMQLRKIGETEGVDFLAARSFPLDEVSSHEVAMVASGMSGDLPYFRGPYDGGAVYFLLGSPPPEVCGAYPTERICTVLTEIISQFAVNHRFMAEHFLRDQGFDFHSEDQSWNAQGDGGRTVTIDFDELGRIEKVAATIGPSGSGMEQA